MRAFNRADIDDSSGLTLISARYPDVSSVVELIRQAYENYRELSAIGVAPVVLTPAQKEALKLAYSSKAKSAGLDWIKGLHDSHAFNFCPLCGGAGARTIDHHLPATNYREFSVFSFNLLPSCDSCNRKRNDSNQYGSMTTLHPFFDSRSLDLPILSTRIVAPYEAPDFELEVMLPSDGRDARISNHVERSVDLVAFGTWTLGAWDDIKTQVAPRHSSESSLKVELLQNLSAETKNGNRNSWNAALTRGLLKDRSARQWLVSHAVPIELLTDMELGI